MIKRRLTCFLNDERVFTEIVLFKPVYNNGSFTCNVQIKGNFFNINSKIHGEDSLQSLLLAIQFAKTLLLAKEEEEGVNFFWLERGDRGGL